MNRQECKVVQDLLPLYVEDIVSKDTKLYIERHMEQCDECKESQQKMKERVSIRTISDKDEHDNSILKYIMKILLWYLLCPIMVILIIVLGGGVVLRIYEGILMLIALSCIGSEVFHKSTWWDPDCIELQDETRCEEKAKRGKYYVRPIFIGAPAILTIFVLNIPRIIQYISMLM